MEKLTVTEALAEVKLVQKKIDKKKSIIIQNLSRYEHIKDPYPDSAAMVKSEMQSIEDLYTRLISLRKAISKANLDTTVTVGSQLKTITEWLTWKKEVYKPISELYSSTVSTVNTFVKSNAERPTLVKKEDGTEPTLAKLVINVDVPAVNKKAEQVMEINEKLDGLLSLKNATVTIEF